MLLENGAQTRLLNWVMGCSFVTGDFCVPHAVASFLLHRIHKLCRWTTGHIPSNYDCTPPYRGRLEQTTRRGRNHDRVGTVRLRRRHADFSARTLHV